MELDKWLEDNRYKNQSDSEYSYSSDSVSSELTLSDVDIDESTLSADGEFAATKSIVKQDGVLFDKVRAALSGIGAEDTSPITDVYYDANKTVLSRDISSPYKTKKTKTTSEAYGQPVEQLPEVNDKASGKDTKDADGNKILGNKYLYNIISIKCNKNGNSSNRDELKCDADGKNCSGVGTYKFPSTTGVNYNTIKTIMEAEDDFDIITTKPLNVINEPSLSVVNYKASSYTSNPNVLDKDTFYSLVKPNAGSSFELNIFDDDLNKALPTKSEVQHGVSEDVEFDAVERGWRVQIKADDETGYNKKLDLEIVTITKNNPQPDKLLTYLDIKRPEYLVYSVNNTEMSEKLNNGTVNIPDIEKTHGPVYSTTVATHSKNHHSITVRLLQNMFHDDENSDFTFSMKAVQSTPTIDAVPVGELHGVLFTVTLTAKNKSTGKTASYTFPNHIRIYRSSLSIANLFGTNNKDGGKASVDTDVHNISLTGDFTLNVSLQAVETKVKATPGVDKNLSYRNSYFNKDLDVSDVTVRPYSKTQFADIVDNEEALDYRVYNSITDTDEPEDEFSVTQIVIKQTGIVEDIEDIALTIPLMNIVGIPDLSDPAHPIKTYHNWNAKNAFLLRTIPGYLDGATPPSDKTLLKNSATFYWNNEYGVDYEKKNYYYTLDGVMNIGISAVNKPGDKEIVQIVSASENNSATFNPSNDYVVVKPIATGIIQGENMEDSRNNIVSDDSLSAYLKARKIPDTSDMYDLFKGDTYVTEYEDRFPYDMIVTDDGIKPMTEVIDDEDHLSDGMTWYEAIIQAFSKENIRLFGEYLLDGQVRVNKEAIQYIYNNVFMNGSEGVVGFINNLYDMIIDHKGWIDINKFNINSNTKNLIVHESEINGIRLKSNGSKGQYTINTTIWKNITGAGTDYEPFTLVRSGNRMSISGILVAKTVTSARGNTGKESLLFTITTEIRPKYNIRVPITIYEWESAGNFGTTNKSLPKEIHAYLLIKTDGTAGIMASPQNKDFAKPLYDVLDSTSAIDTGTTTTTTTTTVTTTIATTPTKKPVKLVESKINRPYVVFSGEFFIGS